MKVERYNPVKSSFLSIEKDMGIIVREIFSKKGNRLQNLLYYDCQEALKKDYLTDEQKISLMGTHIKLVPKLQVDRDVRQYMIINFDKFTPNRTNPEFRDNVIEFDIVCHFDQWNLGDFQLRPYKIAAEIDTLFNERHLTGIGKLEFLGCNQIVLTDEFAGLTMLYAAVHGEEDKNDYTPAPEDEYKFEQLFKELEELDKEEDE